MFVQVRSLSKGHIAALKITNVGFFIGMDPQVIIEVVPLPAFLSALFIVTFEYFYYAATERILKRKDSELVSLRRSLLDLDRVQIKGRSELYMDRISWFEFSEGLAVSNIRRRDYCTTFEPLEVGELNLLLWLILTLYVKLDGTLGQFGLYWLSRNAGILAAIVFR